MAESVTTWLSTFLSWQAADSGGGTDLAMLSQYGVLGIFSAILIVFARVAYRRETDRSDRLEAEVFRLNSVIQERAIPALESATKAVESSQQIVREMQERFDAQQRIEAERWRTEGLRRGALD